MDKVTERNFYAELIEKLLIYNNGWRANRTMSDIGHIVVYVSACRQELFRYAMGKFVPGYVTLPLIKFQ